MTLFGGILSIKAVTFLMFSVFAIAVCGYALGSVTVKGINLGTAGVFIAALLYGCFFYDILDGQLAGGAASYTTGALKIIENTGLVLFVASVGFIAGPNFFDNLKRNFKSYVLLGLVIIVSGGLACAVCILAERRITGAGSADTARLREITSMLTGLFAGALTSTPAFSAAKETVGSEFESIVSVGYGIAYLFGVIGVVLFVQIIPKLTRADMAAERRNLTAAAQAERTPYTGRLIELDPFGLAAFSAAAVIGIFVGSLKFGSFSLTMTGGSLLTALVLGHFRHIGPVAVMPKQETLKVLRELGLAFFLIGAGVSGGANFVKYFKPVYFLYGVVMTTLPMILGYLFARYVLKLCLLNNLGSITGGMTSTPALGTLIHVAGTEDAAAAYAATYPIALIAVVIVSQVLIILF